jgi:hypothetical protein
MAEPIYILMTNSMAGEKVMSSACELASQKNLQSRTQQCCEEGNCEGRAEVVDFICQRCLMTINTWKLSCLMVWYILFLRDGLSNFRFSCKDKEE